MMQISQSNKGLCSTVGSYRTNSRTPKYSMCTARPIEFMPAAKKHRINAGAASVCVRTVPESRWASSRMPPCGYFLMTLNTHSLWGCSEFQRHTGCVKCILRPGFCPLGNENTRRPPYRSCVPGQRASSQASHPQHPLRLLSLPRVQQQHQQHACICNL